MRHFYSIGRDMGNFVSATSSASREMIRTKEPSKRLEHACTLLAWGSNNHGQCGVPNKGMVLHPTEVKELRGKKVGWLSAGYRSSCAIIGNGEVYSWGLNTSGQLGLGTCGDVQLPSPVEAFHGHTRVRSAAIGKSHALFLDHKGGVWGVGDNKHGQLGLGTRMPAMHAMLQLADWSVLTAPSHMGMVAMSGAGHRVHRMRQIAAGTSSFDTSEWLAAPINQLRIKAQLQALADKNVNDPIEYNEFLANNAVAASMGILDEPTSSSLLTLQGIQDGQYYTPVRTGRDEHPLFRPPSSFAASPLSTAPSADAEDRDEDIPRDVRLGKRLCVVQPYRRARRAPPRSLGGQVMRRIPTFEEEVASYSQGLHMQSVVKVAASKLFSAALTGDGTVWTFGSGVHYELGTSDIVHASARPIRGRLARLLEDHGGTVDIALGMHFCVALTRDGTVVAWGNVPSSDAGGGDGNTCVIVGEDAGLPPMLHIAAGANHALMSDGEKVWLMGTMKRQENDQAKRSWKHPMPLAFEGIGAATVKQLVSAGQAGAMVDDSERLWMWGRLSNATSGDGPAVELADGRPVAPCLNSFTLPVVVKDIGRVAKVALGTNHVLAAVSNR